MVQDLLIEYGLSASDLLSAGNLDEPSHVGTWRFLATTGHITQGVDMISSSSGKEQPNSRPTSQQLKCVPPTQEVDYCCRWHKEAIEGENGSRAAAQRFFRAAFMIWRSANACTIPIIRYLVN